MPATYSIHHGERAIYIACHGILSDEELVSLQAQVLGDPGFSPDYTRLIDVTGVTDFQVSGRVVRGVANRIQATPGAKYAIVADQDVAFGLARMYGIAAEPGSSIEIFRTGKEARKWLGLPAADARRSG